MKSLVKVAVAIIVTASFAAACSKKDACSNIHDYAPAGLSVDWEGYNSVETVAKYFQGHDSTIVAHIDEQIDVYGYFRTDNYWCYLTSDSIPPYRYAIPLYIPEGMQVPTIDRQGVNRLTTRIATLPWDTACHSIKLSLTLQSINNENQ